MSSGNNGRILGAIAGAALAYFTGGMSVLGGAALGSAVGGMLDKSGSNTQGPRLDDLKVQVSTYGGAIPTVYGTMRVGGNVIWSTDKLEIGTTQTAGKGGGASNTSYKYYVHMAIALCYGPITGIRKIWQDGRLIYDASSGAPLASALASASNLFANVQLYYGDESQLPDPIIESWEGVGNVPAYRGIAYVRMIAVECPGGRVPQFSFEASTSLSSSVSVQNVVSPVSMGAQAAGGICTSEGAWHYAVDTGATPQVTFFACGAGYTRSCGGSSYPAATNMGLPRAVAGSKYQVMRSRNPQSGPNALTYFIETVDMSTGVAVQLASMPTSALSGGWDNHAGAAYDPVSGGYAFMTTGSAYGGTPFIMGGGGSYVVGAPLSGYGGAIAYYSGALYAVCCSGYPSGTISLVIYDSNGNIINTIAGPAGSWASLSCAVQVDATGTYLFLYPGGSGVNGSVYKLNSTGTWNLRCSALPLWSSGSGGVAANPVFWTDGSQAVTGPHADGSYKLTVFASFTPVAVSVGGIISDQCTKAGLTTAQIDVSTLQDTAWGYLAANVASARNNLQPLLTACAIDAVDEDGKVKFFKRAAITSMATVTYNELGCVDGNGTPGDPMPLTRTQEAELPSSVAVNYINSAYDYQTVTETARRSTDLTRNDQTVDLPLACSADFAASVAQMLLYDAWNERNRRTAQVSRKWAYLSAGDGVTVEYPQGTFQLWRLSKVTDTGTLLQWELSPADATIYTQQAIGSPTLPALQVMALPPPTNAQIIDGPILQDADNNAGLYVAMSGYASPFPGAELFVGNDAAALSSRGTVQNEAPTGFAETVPGAWDSTSIDETNLITVNMGRFTLSSCTRDVLLAGQTNVAAYGANGRWEIIAFRTVNSLGSGRYTISGLLRSQRGTEWASGLHQANDSFVMLGHAGVLRPVLDAGMVGTTKLYRAITAGRSTGVDQTYASTAEGLKCFSPVNVRKSVDASNNVTLTWDRRTRLSQNWLTGIVPLGETGESYSVDFYTSSGFTAIAGTFAATSPTLTLTAAQQTAIGLTPGATAYVNVYQVSSSIGRGHAAQATV